MILRMNVLLNSAVHLFVSVASQPNPPKRQSSKLTVLLEYFRTAYQCTTVLLEYMDGARDHESFVRIMSRQPITWRREGHTAIVTFQSDDNRVTPVFISSFNTILDAVENDKNIRALVTTNEGKVYSNGLPPAVTTLSLEEITPTIKQVNALFQRILTFPMVTVAAINGHAFAAGALLSLAHDYRVMRSGRGWFCMPEIKLKLRFTMDFLQLLKTKLPPDQYVNCVLYGKRYTAEEAKRVGIIQEYSERDKVLDTAVALANDVLSWQEGAYDRNTLGQMKKDLYHDVIKVFINNAAKLHSQL